MVNIFNTAGVVVTLPNMDRFGRRRLAIGGAIGMAIPHIIMSGIVSKYHKSWSSHQAVGWFGVAMISFTIYSIPLGHIRLAN
jgi:Sugar (and other) transporter.